MLTAANSIEHLYVTTRLFLRSAVVVAGVVIPGSLLSPPAAPAADINITTNRIGPGVEYLHKQVKKVPWSVHVVRWERGMKDLDLITTLPSGSWLGLSPTTTQLKFIPALSGKPLAAINGDFFSWRKGPYQGDVAGLQIMNGELVSAPHSASKNASDAPLGTMAFWIDESGEPHLEKVTSLFEVRWPGDGKMPFRLNETCDEDEAVLYTHAAGFTTRTTNGMELVLERNEKVKKGPWLPLAMGETYSARVRAVGITNNALSTNTVVLSIGSKLAAKVPKLAEGAIVELSTMTTPLLKNVKTAIGGGPALVHHGKRSRGGDTERHPRAAFGWNDLHYFFVVVDGRRAGISDGMNFAELTDEMLSWGCKEVLNLDGGGSAMLWADGAIRNQPSENRERPCANALVLLRKDSRALTH